MIYSMGVTQHVLSGPEHRFEVVPGVARRFIQVCVPFAVARDLFKPVFFDGQTGRGEQRHANDAHTRRLVRRMLAGAYTPTPVNVTVPVDGRAAWVKTADGLTTVTVPAGRSLSLVDGHHRGGALDLLARGQVADRSLVMSCPVPAIVYLDGDPQDDFLNLQDGLGIDANTKLSMRIAKGRVPKTLKGELDTALAVARILNETDLGADNPFYRAIRFEGAAPFCLRFVGLCPRSPGDLATSLVGLAKAATGADPDQLADVVWNTYAEIREARPDLTQPGLPFAAAPDWTEATARQYLGAAVCMAHRLRCEGRLVATATEGGMVLKALSFPPFSEKADASADAARRLATAYARGFFGDVPPDLRAKLGDAAYENVPCGDVFE